MAQFRTDTNKYLGDGKTIHEVVMLSDRLTASGTTTDAFGRIRTSNPYTLFDSTHRYIENPKWNTSTSGTANTQYQANESSVNMNIGTASGDKVYRETKRVFHYQPGKSLLVMNTFVMTEQKTNVRQRVGYFSSQNGVFLENDGTGNYFVIRTYTSGSVVETRVAQSSWNMDKFDGTGYSSQSSNGEHTEGLDITKTNILWFDIEWLGVGDIRCGFVVDGRMVVAHVFHNDNLNTLPYMTTAILPIRYEIENTGTSASASTMKQICSTVISEGGYELRGRQKSISVPLASPKDIPTAGTFVPIISIRLKDAFQDSVVLPSGLSLFGVTNNTNYRWKVVTGGTLTGASWVSFGADSSVEYDFTATAITGGIDRSSGYVNVSAGAGAAESFLRSSDLFDFQLERDGFQSSNTGFIFSLVATGASNGNDALGHISWEEVA